MSREINQLRTYIGGEEKQKLDKHLSAIENLQTKIEDIKSPQMQPSTPIMQSAMCKKTNRPPDGLDQFTADVSLCGRLQIELMQVALACDMSRIMSMMFLWGTNHTNNARWVPDGDGDFHDALSHHGGDPTQLRKYNNVNTWLISQLATMVKFLAETPEDGGMMLDNTIILYGNELSDGNTHAHDRIPFMVIGGKNLGIKGGQYLRFNNTNNNNLLLTIANIMGSPDKKFGNPNYCTGTVAGLV